MAAAGWDAWRYAVSEAAACADGGRDQDEEEMEPMGRACGSRRPALARALAARAAAWNVVAMCACVCVCVLCCGGDDASARDVTCRPIVCRRVCRYAVSRRRTVVDPHVARRRSVVSKCAPSLSVLNAFFFIWEGVLGSPGGGVVLTSRLDLSLRSPAPDAGPDGRGPVGSAHSRQSLPRLALLLLLPHKTYHRRTALSLRGSAFTRKRRAYALGKCQGHR